MARLAACLLLVSSTILATSPVSGQGIQQGAVLRFSPPSLEINLPKNHIVLSYKDWLGGRGVDVYYYNKSASQLAMFHTRLDSTQRFLLANSVCEGLEGDFKQQARSNLVRMIAGMRRFPQLKIRMRKKEMGAPNGLRFTCAAKRSGAASGASAC